MATRGWAWRAAARASGKQGMCHLLAGAEFLMLCLPSAAHVTTQPHGGGAGEPRGLGPLPAWLCLGQQQHTPSSLGGAPRWPWQATLPPSRPGGHGDHLQRSRGGGGDSAKSRGWEANTEQGPPNSKLGTWSLPEAACKPPIREDGSDSTWTGAAAVCLRAGPRCGVGSTTSIQLTALGRDHRHWANLQPSGPRWPQAHLSQSRVGVRPSWGGPRSP